MKKRKRVSRNIAKKIQEFQEFHEYHRGAGKVSIEQS